MTTSNYPTHHRIIEDFTGPLLCAGISHGCFRPVAECRCPGRATRIADLLGYEARQHVAIVGTDLARRTEAYAPLLAEVFLEAGEALDVEGAAEMAAEHMAAFARLVAAEVAAEERRLGNEEPVFVNRDRDGESTEFCDVEVDTVRAPGAGHATSDFSNGKAA